MPYCKSIVKMKQLDLTKFFNYCSISSQDHIRQIPQYIKSTIVSQNIPFQISKNKDAPDTIICCGQHIPIHQKITKLHLLGFCDWGEHSDALTLIDSNDLVQKTEFGFSNMFWGHLGNGSNLFAGEELLRGMRFSICKNFDGYNNYPYVRLYHCVSIVENNNEISKIVLPDNEFIYILAITVE